jgi:hypothetical protein
MRARFSIFSLARRSQSDSGAIEADAVSLLVIAIKVHVGDGIGGFLHSRAKICSDNGQYFESLRWRKALVAYGPQTVAAVQFLARYRVADNTTTTTKNPHIETLNE